MSMGKKVKKIFLFRITTVTTPRHHMNLLYITADETSHYIFVKNLSRLVLRQYNNHKSKAYVSKTCVSYCHQNPSLPNTSISYYVGAAST